MTPTHTGQRCPEGAMHNERIDHLRESFNARMDGIETDVQKISATLNGTNGGIVMRVSGIESDVRHVCDGLREIRATMTNISRAAWGIVTSIGLVVLYWIVSEVAGKP